MTFMERLSADEGDYWWSLWWHRFLHLMHYGGAYDELISKIPNLVTEDSWLQTSLPDESWFERELTGLVAIARQDATGIDDLCSLKGCFCGGR